MNVPRKITPKYARATQLEECRIFTTIWQEKYKWDLIKSVTLMIQNSTLFIYITLATSILDQNLL